VEFHPFLNQKELLDYCRAHHIELISFRSFGKGKLLAAEPLFGQIGAKYRKSGAQVILRWLVQKQISVIPKASSEKHLKENSEIFDFALTATEMSQLDRLHQNKRFCRPDNPEYSY
jgi:diketogulonate reductase-like aldo/keto reductase